MIKVWLYLCHGKEEFCKPIEVPALLPIGTTIFSGGDYGFVSVESHAWWEDTQQLVITVHVDESFPFLECGWRRGAPWGND